MRFDMHCHTKEGSIDGKVYLKDYVLRLKELGYDGMLITDHNSYKAYRQYTKHADEEAFQDFVVLKGIEYDTCDGGHILIIMPSDTMLPILECRGMPVRLLIELVHSFHGILGPSHPTGEKYLSITNCKYYHKHPEVIGEFDFIESYNSCITEEANQKAAALAEQYGLPCTAGSDAHKMDNIGLACTEFDCDITSESDLIDYIKTSPTVSCEGSHYPGTSRDHLGVLYDMQLRLYNWYNIFNSMRRAPKRIRELIVMLCDSNVLLKRLMNMFQSENLEDLIQSTHHRKTVQREIKKSDNIVLMETLLEEEPEEEELKANAS